MFVEIKKQIEKLISMDREMEPIVTDTEEVILSQNDIDSRISDYERILDKI